MATKQTPRPSSPERVEHSDIGVGLIDPSPWQPRRTFDVVALAASIRREGLLVPILVRPHPSKEGRYELVDGERRLRAVKRAKLASVRAEVRALTDGEVRRIIMDVAMQDAAFDPVDEARMFRQAIEAGDYKGPTELAKAHGLSQGHVSNRLRLLRLPEDWQARVSGGELPATHALALVRYAEHPRLIEAITREVWDQQDASAMSVEEFADAVNEVGSHLTRSLEGREWRNGSTHDVFTPTPAQRVELGIIEVPSPWENTKTMRATNVALWEELQAESVFQAETVALHGRGTSKNAKPAAKSTPEERKANAKKQAAVLGRRIWEWKRSWLLGKIPTAIIIAPPETLLILAIDLAVARDTWCNLTDVGARTNVALKALAAAKQKVPRLREGQEIILDFPSALSDLPNTDRLHDTIADILAQCYAGEPARTIPGRHVASVADLLGVDQAAAWRIDQKSTVAEEFHGLHTTGQLETLYRELVGQSPKAGQRKSALISELTSMGKTLPMPKSLKNAKPS